MSSSYRVSDGRVTFFSGVGGEWRLKKKKSTGSFKTERCDADSDEGKL